MTADRDVVIIGAGAAGLSAAQYAARANLNALVIEEMAAGGQAMLIDDLENYPGFPEPITGFEFSQRMEVQAKKFGAEFMLAGVKGLKKEDGIFKLDTSKGLVTALTVILSTGAKHRHLDIPGETEFSGKGVSYCAACDGPFFRGKRILVVGGGDAACDEAMYLSRLTPNLVHIHRRDRFRAQKSLAERVQNHEGIEVRFNTVAVEIKGTDKVSSVVFKKTDTGETYEEEFDAVFIFVGSIPQTALVPQLKKDEAGYLVTDQKMQSSEGGLYVVGDVRSTPFRQLVVAAGEGAIAAHSASQYIDEIHGEAYL